MRYERNTIVPYSTNLSPYGTDAAPYNANLSPYMQSYMSARQRYAGSCMRGGGYLPIEPQTIADMEDFNWMAGRRTKRYNPFMKRWETALSDTPLTTTNRDVYGNKISKTVHNMMVYSERYFTAFEVSLKLKSAIAISIFCTLIVSVGAFLLYYFGVFG